jgi:hypothetical protein
LRHLRDEEDKKSADAGRQIRKVRGGMTQADGRMGLQQILQIENKYETKIATFTCGGL